ncbi:hypothetical protein ACFLXE_07605, partial [Chloroflexota bacterium]
MDLQVNFADYFNTDRIIGQLARMRASESAKLHGKHFLRNISEHAPIPKTKANKDKQPLFQMFPARKYWLRPNRKGRKDRSSAEINELALCRTMERLRNSDEHKDADWAVKIEAFIASVRCRVLSKSELTFEEPRIVPLPKKKNIYRPLAIYNLEDRVICGLTAKYLTKVFDEDFTDRSFAFRAKRLGKSVPNHHDAAKALLDYRKRFESQGLWVAECDIVGFYDCVAHSVALEA